MHYSALIDQFWTHTVTGLTAGAIYALVALGYTLVYGVLRLINFAHSEVFMAGTFGAVYTTRWLGFNAREDNIQSAFALIGILLFMRCCRHDLQRRHRGPARAGCLPPAA